MSSIHGKYLGDEVLEDLSETPYKDYTTLDWISYYLSVYGEFDGAHHKQWVLDQGLRIAKGTKVIVKRASWEDGHSEYRITLDEPSDEYLKWLKDWNSDEDYFDWDHGIAP